MEPINPTQAARVWQRVHGPAQEEHPLLRLLALEAECRQICQYLQRNTALRDSRGLHHIREECRRFFHMMQGLAQMLELDVTVTAPPAVRGNPEGLLRQLWQTRQKSIALLDGMEESWAGLLKKRMEEQTLAVPELLGSLPRR